jgi:hypothetical protein
MTIGGWITFIILAILIAVIGGIIAYFAYDCTHAALVPVTIIITIICIIAVYAGIHWCCTNTASGQRALIDQKSNLKGGLERTITIYTADGEVLAEYKGKIDIETNDGGYIKFDLDGKRYIYYNCFVESVAEIE